MIVNRQSRISVPLRELDKFLARARRRLRLPKDSLTVCLVTDAEIACWNRAYRGKSGPTDVLSFATNARKAKRRRARNGRGQKDDFRDAAAAANHSSQYIGDIAIAPAVAKRNASRFGRTFDDEMRILILHGILHLMGYDHEADNGQMERRENKLRRELRLV
ncbi:MAG: rRNA maturation RNase YbeY [Candidatus Acidiferrales bacterium]